MRAAGLVMLWMLAGSDARAEAEHYENVRVDAGIVGAIAGVEERRGTGMAVEIKGMAHDNLSIGGRIEFAVMFGGVAGGDRAELDVGLAVGGLLEAEYLFGTAQIRPFVGFGVGAYTLGGQSIDSGPNREGIARATGRYLGVAPQLGVDVGRFRVAATYHTLFGAYLEVRETYGMDVQTTELSQNWLSFEVSFQFAGGRKRPVAAH